MFANLGFSSIFFFFFFPISIFSYEYCLLLNFALMKFWFSFDSSIFLTQVFYKANDGKKFKQTNVLQKLLKILLMLCTPKRL
jgi:hypothetical protein